MLRLEKRSGETTVRALVRASPKGGWNRSGFFTAAMERFVFNGCGPKHVHPAEHSAQMECPKGRAVSLFTVSVHAGESDANRAFWMRFGEARDKPTAFVTRRK
jgi:hypothetical protein